MTSESKTSYDYDYLVVGAGSGGIASAKRAANHGAKVAIIERARLGGTCVNVGCVPKKVMWCAATIADILQHDTSHYGFSKGDTLASTFDWSKLKTSRDNYVKRLNGIYARGLDNTGVTHLFGDATFVDSNTIKVEMQDESTGEKTGDVKEITADKILIATGGRPNMPDGEGVKENAISSDGFFELEEQPKVAVVVGAGYIAVELAGVMNSLGTEVHLVLRKEKALRDFDPMISEALDGEMSKQGIIIHRNTGGVSKIELDSDKKKIVTTVNGDTIYGADTVLMATGRVPNVETLNLDKANVKLSSGGRVSYIEVDEYSNTSSPNIFALGDVCGRVELTPMAIAAGRRLSDRVFGGVPDAKVSYENVPTVVFSHPTIGTVGITEPKAVEKYGSENLKIYKSKFTNLWYGIFDMKPEDKPKTSMKIICAGITEKVVGVHIIGMGSDEMMQAVGVAVKMGCTKADLDSCVAIHPTASEELVTMGVWGTSPQFSGASVSPLNGAEAGEPTLKSPKGSDE